MGERKQYMTVISTSQKDDEKFPTKTAQYKDVKVNT
jgi:hypothetical protein